MPSTNDANWTTAIHLLLQLLVCKYIRCQFFYRLAKNPESRLTRDNRRNRVLRFAVSITTEIFTVSWTHLFVMNVMMMAWELWLVSLSLSALKVFIEFQHYLQSN